LSAVEWISGGEERRQAEVEVPGMVGAVEEELLGGAKLGVGSRGVQERPEVAGTGKVLTVERGAEWRRVWRRGGAVRNGGAKRDFSAGVSPLL
jgi:hypothetical protein